MSRKTCFTWTKEEFLILCIVNMSVALVMQNKTKISFSLCANFLLFFRHMHKNFSEGIALNADPHQGFALDPLVGLQCPPDPQMDTNGLCALPSVYLNNQSIKKTFVRPLLMHPTTCQEIYFFEFLLHF